MFTYRPKNVEIEAIRWNGKQLELNGYPTPDWIIEGLKKTPERGGIMRVGDVVHVGAVNDILYAQPGDWIVCDCLGNLTVYNNDYFTSAYEMPQKD